MEIRKIKIKSEREIRKAKAAEKEIKEKSEEKISKAKAAAKQAVKQVK